MSMRKTFFIFLLCVLGDLALARDVFYSTAPETIAIARGQKAVLQFEKPVKTISNAEEFEILPADTEQPDYSTLTLKARNSRGSNFVSFLLDDGSQVFLKIVIKAKVADTNGYFRFISQKELRSTTAKKSIGLGKLDLLKAILRDEKVVGYEFSKPEKKVDTGLKGVVTHLERVYSGENYVGYVYRFENISYRYEYKIDLQKLKMGKPNFALLATIDRDLLKPKTSTENEAQLVVIAKASSEAEDAVLPVAWIKKER